MPFRDSNTTKSHSDYFSSHNLLQQQELEDVLYELEVEDDFEGEAGFDNLSVGTWHDLVGRGMSNRLIARTGLELPIFSRRDVTLGTSFPVRADSTWSQAIPIGALTSTSRATLSFVYDPAPKQIAFGNEDEESALDAVSFELSKLAPGWAGPDSHAPKAETIRDVVQVLSRLPKNIAMPVIEVEEEDGSVSLRWLAVDKLSSLSLVFRGNGRFTAVYATVDPPKSRPWSVNVIDEIKLTALLLDEPHMRKLIESE
ncbi:MAG: hypothetical protein HXY30_19680 [Pseudorhodoplanes sp.]|nr:hypothetical protein [Pseudorhodoplanes sp.]